MFLRIKKIAIPLTLFIGLSILYIHNLSRSVYGGDVGDYVTAAFVGGVAHPPGYPLFTLLGFLITRLSFLGTPVFAMGLVAAFSGVFGTILFFLIAKKITGNSLVSLIATLSLSFFYTFWFYGEIPEVFSLLALFFLSQLYVLLEFRDSGKKKYLYIFSLLLGLSFAHHQTIVLVLPSLLILFLHGLLRKKRFKKFTKKEVLVSLLFFLLGLSVYVYIPIAAAHNAIINWDDVHDLASFLHLVLRMDYGTFKAGIFSQPSFWQRIVILKTYGFYLLTQTTLPVVFLSIIGAISLWRKDKILFVSLLTAFIIAGPLFISYAGFPILSNFLLGVYERFFLLSAIVIFLFVPTGLLWICSLLTSFTGKKFPPYLFQIVFFIIPISLCIYNFPKTNLSQVWIGDTFAKDYLETLPYNSVIVLGGDTGVFNTWYVHYALGFRPDIKIINVYGIAQSKEYKDIKNQFFKTHPHAKGDEILSQLWNEIINNHPVFAADPMQPINGEKFIWIPYGLTSKLFKQDQALPTENEYKKELSVTWNKLHIPPTGIDSQKALRSLTISEIPDTYTTAMLATGTFFLSEYHDSQEAISWYNRALNYSPDSGKVHEVLGTYYLTVSRECGLAAYSFRTAMQLEPFDKISYVLLYTADLSCLKDPQEAVSIARQYSKIFGVSILADIKNSEKK